MNLICNRRGPDGFTAHVVLSFQNTASKEKNRKPLDDYVRDGYLGRFQVKFVEETGKKQTFLKNNFQIEIPVT